MGRDGGSVARHDSKEYNRSFSRFREEESEKEQWNKLFGLGVFNSYTVENKSEFEITHAINSSNHQMTVVSNSRI